MQLTLSFEEVGLLRRVLLGYLSDLRMEIAGTEDYGLREALHRDEATLREIIARLDEARPGTGSEREVG